MKNDELAFPFLRELQGTVRLTETSLELPQKLGKKQWEDIGRGLGKIEQSTQWWIGDWWAFGEHQWGDRKELVESEDWTGPAFQTCVQAASVCRAFKETNLRRLVLSFYYHKEVAALPSDERDHLLDWCQEPLENGAKKPRTIRELRDEVKRVKAYLAQGWNASQLERKARLEAGKTVVANMSNNEKGVPVDNALIAWAESQGSAVRIDRQSDWGNPYEVDADGTRDEVIKWYAEYFAHKRSLHKKLKELEGKLLLCWCHPNACHGDFLIEQLSTTPGLKPGA